MPKRRKVLIGLGGAISVAGCAGETEDEEPESEPEPEPEPEPEEESEPEPEPEEESEPEPEPEENQEETSTETEEETEEDQQEEEDQGQQEAIQLIELAKESLEEGLRIYSDFAGTSDASILDVTSANEEFRYTRITNQINFENNVEEYLTNAEEYGIDDLQDEIEVIRKEYSLIDTIVRCQNSGQRTRKEIKEYADNIQQYTNFTLKDKMDGASEEKDEFTEYIGENSAILDELSSPKVRELNVYERKVEQFRGEETAFENYIATDGDIRRGKETLDDAQSAYHSEEYNTAEFRARDAERLFEDALGRLPDSNVAFDDVTESFETDLESLIEDARRLQEQAARQADD